MTLKDYFQKTKKEKWAIGQFNFSTIEQLRAILEAGKELKSPLILGTSEGEVEFLGIKEVIALVEISKTKYQTPVFLNLDHGKNLELIKKAIDFGYNCIHFDGSNLNFKENVKLAKKIVKYAHKKGVLVEGELGIIKGESRIHKSGIKISKEILTSPEAAEDFVKKTNVDSLAVSIGNVHGVYQQMPKIDFERLKEIEKKVNVFLVLHGGSGIEKKEIKKAIKLGISKVNFNTELRIAWKKGLEKALKKTKEIKPYKILPEVQKEVTKKVKEKITLLSSKNKL